MLTEQMDEPCSREVMRACLRDLARVNRWFLAYRPVLRWLDSLALDRVQGPIRLVDVGCGYGDGLRRTEQWAREHGIAMELTGIDLNPDTVAIAAEADGAASNIRWMCADVLAYADAEPIDIVTSSLVMHHLSEPEIVRFLMWMEERAQLGWFINDLSRAPIPYHLFGAFSRLMRLHPFVQHDGPVSIARAFVTEDWQRMCAAAGLREHDTAIEGFAPARLCVARTKPR
jgi:SAM-dependent methyltransferase